MRKNQSVDKNGNPDGTGEGMGWFPGYAIDIESGARLYMAFGENSFLGSDNGSDMIWNPTDRMVSSDGTPIMGGVQPFYVFSYNNKTTNNFILGYDFPEYDPSVAESNATNHLYLKMLDIEANSTIEKRYTYGSLSWVAYPLLTEDQTLLSNDVTIKLRVNKEYKNFVATNENGGNPKYSWNMSSIATDKGLDTKLSEALKLINVVPNPYRAYSEYERNRLDSRVKITNLPERCTIRIFSVNGKLVKTFEKDSPMTYQDWLLTNDKGIKVASGVYLIHVSVPNIGEVVIIPNS